MPTFLHTAEPPTIAAIYMRAIVILVIVLVLSIVTIISRADTQMQTRVCQNNAADGFTGYIPTPAAGQQNHVLTGAGKWTKLGLGITGEKWNDLSDTGTRKPGVVYTNTYSYPIVVSLTATTGSANGYLSLHVSGVEAVLVSSYDPSNPHDRYNTLSAIVPPGSTYVLTLPGGNSSLNRWSELY
jgi:hypothetical protein